MLTATLCFPRALRVLPIAAALLAACGGAPDSTESSDDLKFPSALAAKELKGKLDKAAIRKTQPWITSDALFDQKWAAMAAAPIDFLGGSSAAYYADLGALPAARLPGGFGMCHGDPKADNFGWQLVDGKGVFGDNDFDDAGDCPVAADALRYLVATDLWFADASLDKLALDAYVAAVDDKHAAVQIDPAAQPVWSDVRKKGLGKDTSGDAIVLGGEVQAATAGEKAAVRALVGADSRFPQMVLDVTRNVRTTGGSAGLRRFWIFAQDADGTRTIVELKELATPGTEFGRHTATYDGDGRFDVLKPFWWGSAGEGDYFTVRLLGGRFVARDRMTRANVKPDKMTRAQVENLVAAEASQLALAHRKAWGKVKKSELSAWLSASAATLTARWRGAYAAAGGK